MASCSEALAADRDIINLSARITYENRPAFAANRLRRAFGLHSCEVEADRRHCSQELGDRSIAHFAFGDHNTERGGDRNILQTSTGEQHHLQLLTDSTHGPVRPQSFGAARLGRSGCVLRTRCHLVSKASASLHAGAELQQPVSREKVFTEKGVKAARPIA